jgi:ankyrin repeat protein
MARNKASRTTTTAVVQHERVDLHELLQRAAGGKLKDVKLYLEAGGSARALIERRENNKSIMVPLLHATISAHVHADLAAVIRLLLKEGADLRAVCSTNAGNQASALMWACRNQRHCNVAVEVLLESGAHPCWQTSSPDTTVMGGTALHFAVVSDQPVKCEMLIRASKGHIVNMPDRSGQTPLAVAVNSNLLHIFKLLQRHGADLKTRDNRDRTLLHWAAEKSGTAVLQHVLDSGEVDVNAVQKDGFTALYKAAAAGNLDAAKLLVQHGADLTALSLDGADAIFAAAHGGSVSVLEYMQSLGLPLTSKSTLGMSLLSAAAQKGHMHALQYLIDEGVSLTDTNVVGHTPLFDAVVWGHADAVQLLLDAGSDIQHVSHNGTTALCTAVARHLELSADPIPEVASKTAFFECAKVLLDAGADIEHVSSSGHSSLSTAVLGGSADLVQLLLQRGAAIDGALPLSPPCGKVTALMACNAPAVVKLLLAAGADVHAVSSKGYTCLHTAVIHDHSKKVLCLLIKAGVNLAAVDYHGLTAAEIARIKGNHLAASLLMRAARDVKA